MKIIKIFGAVVGLHVFILIFIFVNPGCSSTTRPPTPSDTAAQSQPPPSVTVPSSAPIVSLPGSDAPAPAVLPPSFDPDAPAVAASPTVRFTPTRPGSPAATTLVTEPVLDVTPATTYSVRSGDSLWSIAKKNRVTVAELAAANGLNTNVTLRLGQKLLIPGKPASPTVAAAANPAAAGKTAEVVAVKPPAETMKHTVKSGETLSTIARDYGVRTRDLAMTNNITDPQKLRAGMELIIPGWQPTGSKAGSAAAAQKSQPAANSSKGASPAPKPIFIPDGETNSNPPPPSEVPVIRVEDDSPIAPAPKS